MGIVVLRNHTADAAVQQLRFDLKTGRFLTQSEQIVNRCDLASVLGFTHPILEEKPLVQTAKNQYSYIYHNDEEFCLALRYAYATLLQVEDPALCSIRIQPAEQYLQDTQQYKIYFSCHPNKSAVQQLSTLQLNAMLNETQGVAFQYCNHDLLDHTLTWVDFAEEIDADTLYQTSSTTPQSGPGHQICLDQYELRFINTQIGFGLFSRTAIGKGELIFQYCGKFVPKNLEYWNYSYAPKKDCGYSLMLDAKYIGNASRFVNHAPEHSVHPIPQKYLTANVGAENRKKYGTSRIMLIANRDIAPGEQILSSYGCEYYATSENCFFITKSGVVTDGKQRRVKNNAAKLSQYLSVFARYDIKRAQWLLLRRPLTVLFLCVGFGFWLR